MANETHDPDQDLEGGKMPLLDHLMELRHRLMISAVAFIACFLVGYALAEHIFTFLVQPLADITAGQQGRRMIFTALHEAFFTYVKVGFFFAACVSFPIVSMQIWLFVAPGLYKHERRAVLPFLFATPVLFTLGASMVYYVVVPLAWKFFLGFEHPGGPGDLPLVLEPKVDQYLSLVMRLIFAFGAAFELPVLIVLLVRVGILDVATLRAKRKYAIVVAFIVAAVLTPPDVISQIMLALPILLLYEIAILCSVFIEKKRAEAEAADQS